MNNRVSKLLYVGNLSVLTEIQALTDIFIDTGNIVKADIVMNDNSKSRRCFAIIEMSSYQEADSAVEKLNGTVVQGRAIKIRKMFTEEPNL